MSSTLEFWLSNGGERMRLPVNPSIISLSYGRDFEDVTVSHLGEYTVPQGLTLTNIEFSSHLPKYYDPGYCEYSNIPDPWGAVQTINKWLKAAAGTTRLIITGTPINLAVSIRDFQIEERGGSVGDIYYSISLKEYRFITFNKVVTIPPPATPKAAPKPAAPKPVTPAPRPPAPKSPTTGKVYVVVKGDSLWKIAQKKLGKGSRWPEIYNKNKSVIGGNPNLIKPGQRLTLP